MLYPFSRLFSPARSPASGSPAARKKRGFNLIEAAVVLGVVGLVIGGIWVAANAVSNRTKYNKLRTEIMQIYRAVNNLYGNMEDSNDITSLVIDAGLASSDMIDGATLKDPWGNQIIIEFERQRATNSYYFGILITGNSPSECIDIVWNVLTSIQLNSCRQGGASMNHPLVVYPTNGSAIWYSGASSTVSVARSNASSNCIANNGVVGLKIPLCQ